jgi:hypothetical protein
VRFRLEAIMWRLLKAIVVSWVIGVACGIVIAIVAQKHDQSPPVPTASVQSVPQTSGAAPSPQAPR